MTKTINEQSNDTLQGQTLKILFAKCSTARLPAQIEELLPAHWIKPCCLSDHREPHRIEARADRSLTNLQEALC